MALIPKINDVVDDSLKHLICDVLDSADCTGCSDDLTVVSAAAVEKLKAYLFSPAVPKKWTFEGFRIADISLAYLQESDLNLIGRHNAPNHLANIDPVDPEETDGPGSFYLPSLPEPEDEWTEFEANSRQFGLSERFIAIMRELWAQGFSYVRFDADGGEVEGLAHADPTPSIQA